MGKDKPGKHEDDRDGQGNPQPDKWTSPDKKDDGNKHEKK